MKKTTKTSRSRDKPLKQAKHELARAAVTILIILALLGGLVIGWLADHAINRRTARVTNPPTSATRAADFRASLVTLGVQHATLTDQAIDAALDGSKSADSIGLAMYANGNQLGATLGRVYGSFGEQTFDAIWKIQLDQLVTYSVAASMQDETGKKAALDTIDAGFTKPLSQYLAKANHKLSEPQLEALLSSHVALATAMIDDHIATKYTAELATLNQADKNITGFFSLLANAIVKQHPKNFQD